MFGVVRGRFWGGTWACIAAVAVSFSGGCSKTTSGGVATQFDGTIPGTLRYASVNSIKSLNPLTQGNTDEVFLDMFIFGFFFEVNDKGQLVPDLATEVPTLANGGISKDGLTITYHLRKGVTWHDGAPFTARDVAFTVSALLNPKNNVFSRAGWDDIRRVEIVDDYEVRMHLFKPYGAAIVTYFCPYQHSGTPVLPAHILDKYSDLNTVPFATHPIGLGPYKFVRWVPGDHIDLEAYPKYWRGRPKLDHVVIKIVPSEATVVTELQTHELDAYFVGTAAIYDRVKSLPGYRFTHVPNNGFEAVALNQSEPLFADVRVRRALAFAVDKKRIINDVLRGLGEPTPADVPPESWAFDRDVPTYGYDPNAALAVMAQAGWKRGSDGTLEREGQRMSLTLSALAGDATAGAIAVLVQSEWREIGVDVTLKTYPADLYYAPAFDGGILTSGKFQAALVGQSTGVDPEDSNLFTCAAFSPKGGNEPHWCDNTFDAADEAAMSTYDPAVRKRYYAITQSELVKQVPEIFLYFGQNLEITSGALHGVSPAPVPEDDWNTWAWSMD